MKQGGYSREFGIAPSSLAGKELRSESYLSSVTLGKFDELTLFQSTENQGFTPVEKKYLFPLESG